MSYGAGTVFHLFLPVPNSIKTGSVLLYAYFAMKEAMTATRILTSLEAWFMDRVKGVTRSTGTAAYRRIPDYHTEIFPSLIEKINL